jgi:hypothetical protein
MCCTDRITIRNDLSVINVNVNVTVSDLKVSDELPEEEMGDARGRIGVRVLSDPVGITVLSE